MMCSLQTNTSSFQKPRGPNLQKGESKFQPTTCLGHFPVIEILIMKVSVSPMFLLYYIHTVFLNMVYEKRLFMCTSFADIVDWKNVRPCRLSKDVCK